MHKKIDITALYSDDTDWSDSNIPVSKADAIHQRKQAGKRHKDALKRLKEAAQKSHEKEQQENEVIEDQGSSSNTVSSADTQGDSRDTQKDTKQTQEDDEYGNDDGSKFMIKFHYENNKLTSLRLSYSELSKSQLPGLGITGPIQDYFFVVRIS